MGLRDITRGQVLAAIAECDRLGRDDFLRQYGFDRARSYVLIYDDKAYDSKAIVGAAHGRPPGKRPLTSAEFSGGEATVGRLLRRLGFTVAVESSLLPSVDELVNRVTGLRVNRASGRPALYQPVTLLWAIGRARRGEPRIEGWDETRQSLQTLLKRYGFHGERPRADYPIAALYHAGLWELQGTSGSAPNAHGDAELLRWFHQHRPSGGLISVVYNLVRYSGEARIAVVDAILDTFFYDTDYVELLEDVGLADPAIAENTADDVLPHSPLEAEYERLCRIVERHHEQRSGARALRIASDPVRSAAARHAVLIRSKGRCENPHCPGQPSDLTDKGDPILEVDHVHELADGGPDDPEQMVALCPNCHAVKTRGRTREQLRELLLDIAKQRHSALLSLGSAAPTWAASRSPMAIQHPLATIDRTTQGNEYAAHAPLRAILDHVPPMLDCPDFKAVANNYPWGRTDKNYAHRLLDFKLQADDALHRQISAKTALLTMDDMPPRVWVNRILQECAG